MNSTEHDPEVDDPNFYDDWTRGPDVVIEACPDVTMVTFDPAAEAERREAWRSLVESMPNYEGMAEHYDNVYCILETDPLGICLYELGESALIIIETPSYPEGMWAIGLRQSVHDVPAELETRANMCSIGRNMQAVELPDVTQGCEWTYFVKPEVGFLSYDLHIEYPPGWNQADTDPFEARFDVQAQSNPRPVVTDGTVVQK